MAARALQSFFLVRWYRAARKFIREAINELREVVWPSWDEVKHYTILVLCVLIGVSLWIGLFEVIFNWVAADLLDLYGNRGL